MTTAIRCALTIALCAGIPSIAVSQGTLSTQGLGFPPGQLSTRARIKYAEGHSGRSCCAGCGP